MIKKIYRRFKDDRMYLLCWIITIISIAAGVLFPNALLRLAESIKDLFTSLLYYCCEIVSNGDNPISPTVVEQQKWNVFNQVWEPVKVFPSSISEFFAFWGSYFKLVFSSSYFVAYLRLYRNIIFYGARVLLVLMPIIVLWILKVNSIKSTQVTERNLKSKQLIAFERFYFKFKSAVVLRVKLFIDYCKDCSGFVTTWILLFLLYFNVYSIVLSLIAYYLYFITSWNIFSLYNQILKLQIDLTPVIRFVPGIIWFVLAYWLYNNHCRNIGFQRLYYAERCNRAFLRERGVVTIVYGPMGVGKTSLLTSMALSSEIEMYDQAYEIMLDKDIMFPNFPWVNLRDDIKKRIETREIVNLQTCKNYINGSVKDKFETVMNRYTALEYNKRCEKLGMRSLVYGYDYDHYALTYNDDLKISTLYEAIESYACAYMIFMTRTSLLFSNYSIRVDSILEDLENFPVRNNDFFHKSAEYQAANQRHSHIIDFDMLRLGKKLMDENPQAHLSYGVYVITEIDKERKNQLDLKELKIKDEETNQKNDLFNACLMMSRHAAVVDNKVFIRIICDLQRPEAWGAGGRELGEVIYIKDKSELAPVLPFYSPYWLFQGLFEFFKRKWTSFYEEYQINRSDNILSVYLFKNIIAKINNYYSKQNGLFGMQTLNLEIQSGTLEGEVKTDKWRLLTKKDRSNRYRTDCLESVFESYDPNILHVDEFKTYADILASQEECKLQNSYFQNDIRKMKGV